MSLTFEAPNSPMAWLKLTALMNMQLMSATYEDELDPNIQVRVMSVRVVDNIELRGTHLARGFEDELDPNIQL